MKVIFLDFDGVLNTEKYVSSCGHFGLVIDPSRLELLKGIVDATDAKIVLSTSWREHWDKDAQKCDETGREINEIFGRAELTVYDKTPTISRFREDEIETWLKVNSNVENFVILDDRFLDSQKLRGHFVKTSGRIQGLNEECVKSAVHILNKPCEAKEVFLNG